ncbi:YfiR family protein [Bowmanella denitrificans]|uniref:YfiR family protein n=1 Tax=Bowmanella denitrificans TaxID=366582 RepID=UPI000C9A412E|nr:YfiR family protein [Bowmanella denitrificans]
MRQGLPTLHKLLLLCALLLPTAAFSQGFSSEQLRAPFLLHIANFTQFVDEDSQLPVNFCFLEDKNYAHAKVFQSSPNQQVKQRPIKLVELAEAAQIDGQDCQVLFVGQSMESDELFERLAKVNQQTVSIGESINFIQRGGMMAIVPLQSKMKIFFNQDVYEQTSLKFSSALLKRVNFR